MMRFVRFGTGRLAPNTFKHLSDVPNQCPWVGNVQSTVVCLQRRYSSTQKTPKDLLADPALKLTTAEQARYGKALADNKYLTVEDLTKASLDSLVKYCGIPARDAEAIHDLLHPFGVDSSRWPIENQSLYMDFESAAPVPIPGSKSGMGHSIESVRVQL